MPRSRRALLAALGSGLAVGAAGCTGTADEATTTRPTDTSTTTRTTTTTSAPRPGEPRWTLETGTEPGALLVRDGRVYFGSDAVYALAPDGTERWRYTADRRVQSLIVDGQVYATTGDFHPSPAGSDFALHALDGGSELWSFARDGAGMLSKPAVGPEHVFVATRNDYLQSEGQTLYGFSTGGDQLWSTGVGDPDLAFAAGTLFASYPRNFTAFDPDGTERWSKSVEEVYPSLVGVHGDTAFVFWQGTLHALALGDGTERWSKSAAGATVPADDTLYTITDGGVAAALDPATGAARWEQSVAAFGRVTVAGGTVYVLGKTVAALNAADGSVRWTHAFARKPFEVAVNSSTFAATVDGTLHALDVADGHERWTFTPDATDDAHIRWLALGAETVYGALGNGTLYALRA